MLFKEVWQQIMHEWISWIRSPSPWAPVQIQGQPRSRVTHLPASTQGAGRWGTLEMRLIQGTVWILTTFSIAGFLRAGHASHWGDIRWERRPEDHFCKHLRDRKKQWQEHPWTCLQILLFLRRFLMKCLVFLVFLAIKTALTVVRIQRNLF